LYNTGIPYLEPYLRQSLTNFKENSEGFDKLKAEVLEGNFGNQTQTSRDSITKDMANLIGEFLNMLLM